MKKKLRKLADSLESFNEDLKKQFALLRKENKKNILQANLKLISEICRGEDLDEIKLIDKYLKKKSKSKKDISDEDDKNSSKKEELLNHITFEGTEYFYEDKANGNVYNDKSERVGVFKLGKINFESC